MLLQEWLSTCTARVEKLAEGPSVQNRSTHLENAEHSSPPTFSTVWHCEHLVLKIFAPALVDMVCWQVVCCCVCGILGGVVVVSAACWAKGTKTTKHASWKKCRFVFFFQPSRSSPRNDETTQIDTNIEVVSLYSRSSCSGAVFFHVEDIFQRVPCVCCLCPERITSEEATSKHPSGCVD